MNEKLIAASEAIEKRIYDVYVSKHKCKTCLAKDERGFCSGIHCFVSDDFHCMLWEEQP